MSISSPFCLVLDVHSLIHLSLNCLRNVALTFQWLESSFHWPGLPLLYWWDFVLVEISTPVSKFITTYKSFLNSAIIRYWLSQDISSVIFFLKSKTIISYIFQFLLNTCTRKICMEFKMP